MYWGSELESLCLEVICEVLYVHYCRSQKKKAANPQRSDFNLSNEELGSDPRTENPPFTCSYLLPGPFHIWISPALH